MLDCLLHSRISPERMWFSCKVMALAACLALCTGSNNQESDRAGEAEHFMQIMDQRYPGEFTCHANSSRPTTYGIDVLQHSFSPLRPGNCLGDKIMAIEMEVSADCATWVPVGYNIEKTKRSVLGVQTKETDSLISTARMHGDQFGVSVSGALKMFSASANYDVTKTTSDRHRTERRYKCFVTWTENVDNTLRFSYVDPPPLTNRFRARLTAPRTISQYSPTFFWNLTKVGTHFLERAELGSQFTEIRRIDWQKVTQETKNTDEKGLKAGIAGNFKEVSFNAAGGYGTSSSSETLMKDIAEHSETYRVTTGDHPNLRSMSFEVTKNPGIIRKTLQPICALFPNHPAIMREAKEQCYDFFKSVGYCFSQFPDLESLYEEKDVHLLQEHFVALAAVEQCKNIPPPTFGLRLESHDTSSFIYSDTTLRDCIWTAIRNNHKMISFQEGRCITISRNERNLYDQRRCEGSSCVVIRFEWPSDGHVFLNKESTVVGEYLLGKATKTVKWRDNDDFCTLHNVMYNMYKTNPTPSNNDVHTWNMIMRRTLTETGADCERDCKNKTGECRFVRKDFQFAWNKFGLTKNYRNKQGNTWSYCDPNGDVAKFKQDHPIELRVQCNMYASLLYVTTDFDRASLVNEYFGKLFTSQLTDVYKWTRPDDNIYRLIDEVEWSKSDIDSWLEF